MKADFAIDCRSAAVIYNTLFEPVVVGSDGDGNPVHQVTPASATAQLLGLPFYLSDAKSEIQAAHRVTAAAFFRQLAEALDQGSSNG